MDVGLFAFGIFGLITGRLPMPWQREVLRPWSYVISVLMIMVFPTTLTVTLYCMWDELFGDAPMAPNPRHDLTVLLYNFTALGCYLVPILALILIKATRKPPRTKEEQQAAYDGDDEYDTLRPPR